ncbi:MAG: transketolase C-terminal domain-containing protein [Chitinophagaceae bacterium]
MKKSNNAIHRNIQALKLPLHMLSDFPIQNEKETRAGFGEGIYEVAQKNKHVVALTADLAGSLKLQAFIKDFPERFIQCGIAEANMIGIAAGLTIGGKIPYTTTFANFSTSRVYDQIRQSVAYSGKNVKICASHAGLTLGEDGATHQVLEDIGMMKMLPGMTVIVPCDFNQTKAATIAIADHIGPVYLRFGRPKWPNFTPLDTPFEIGKAQQINEGNDVSIFACGHMVYEAMKAVKILEKEGISCDLINIHTIKPIDQEAVVKSISKTNCIVTAEEHQINGGLGDSIAQIASKMHPCPQEYVAVQDSFGESGKPMDLLQKYGLTSENIILSVKKVLSRKRK